MYLCVGINATPLYHFIGFKFVICFLFDFLFLFFLNDHIKRQHKYKKSGNFIKERERDRDSCDLTTTSKSAKNCSP